MSRADSATSLIPVSYIGDQHLIRSDGLPVLVWEIIEGKNLYTMVRTELESFIENYSRLFSSLQENEIVQFVSSYRPLDPMEVYEKYSKDAGDRSEFMRTKLLPTQKDWLRRMAISSSRGRIKYYLLYSIKRPKPASPEEIIREITNKSLGLLSYLSRLGITARTLDQMEIKDMLDREISPFMNSLTDKAFSQAQPSAREGDGFLSHREALARDAIIVHADHLEFGSGMVARTLYLRALPFESVDPFMCKIFTQCGYFRVSQYAYGLDQQIAYAKFERQFIQSGQRKHMDKNYDAQISATEDRSKVLIDRFAAGQLNFCRFNFYITLYADTLEELNDNTAALKSVCADYPLVEGFREQDILYRSSLPCCFDLAAARIINSDRREYTTADGLANAFPFIHARVGMKGGAVIGFDALGEPVHFDQWAREELENPVHVILGQMGSGKSFLQEIVEARQAPFDVVTCIFHKSNNYDFSTRLLGGQVIDFDLDSETKLNVFDPADPQELIHGPSPDTVSLIVSFLNIILTDAGSSGIGALEEGVLDGAIRETYVRKRGETPILEDLADTLEALARDRERSEHRLLYKNLRLKLDPYIGQGSYANLTNRRSTVNIASSRVVLNLSKIPENNNKIFALSMFTASSIMGKVLAANRGKSKLKVKFDETWAFLKSPAGASLIDNLVRRARHLNIALDIVTQFPSDLLSTESAKSVIQGAKCITLLQQSPTDFPLLKEMFGLNDAELEIIRHLGQVKGVYSEAYMITGKRRGLVRIMPDPHTYWIATSEPIKDLPARAAALKKHAQKNGSTDMWAAVEELARGA